MTIKDASYLYVRVQGIIWLINGLSENTNVRSNVCAELTNIYRTESPDIPFIIDFKQIESIADHAIDSLMDQIIKIKRPVILANINLVEAALYLNVPSTLTTERFRVESDKTLHIAIWGSYTSLNINAVINRMVCNFIELAIKKSFKKFPDFRHLSSTPFSANGIYDANVLLSNHETFYWISLTLNDILNEIIAASKDLKYPVKLLSVSLRSAPFASVVSQLSRIPLETIDHLGPRHKVFDLDILTNIINKEKYTYIYVGDFCFGGTEIKIAKTYAQFAQSKFESAVVIGSLFDPDAFVDDFKLKTIIDLGKIGTDLGAIYKLI